MGASFSKFSGFYAFFLIFQKKKNEIMKTACASVGSLAYLDYVELITLEFNWRNSLVYLGFYFILNPLSSGFYFLTFGA